MNHYAVLTKALLLLHSLTGCDMRGKVAGISKEFWLRHFMNEEYNQQIIQSLSNFAEGIISEIIEQSI